MSNDDAGDAIAREDELLELLYWFEGEGFGGVATIGSITRFTNLEEALVRRTLDRLLIRGDVTLGWNHRGYGGPHRSSRSRARGACSGHAHRSRPHRSAIA